MSFKDRIQLAMGVFKVEGAGCFNALFGAILLDAVFEVLRDTVPGYEGDVRFFEFEFRLIQ